jgi:hypothetical protein
MLHSIKPTRVRWQGAPPGLSGRRVSSFALSKINLRPPDSEWVAQVSLFEQAACRRQVKGGRNALLGSTGWAKTLFCIRAQL